MPLTAIVIVEPCPEITDAGLNDIETPLGAPEALRLTDCAEPLVIAVEIATVPVVPVETVGLVGDALWLKSLSATRLWSVRC